MNMLSAIGGSFNSKVGPSFKVAHKDLMIPKSSTKSQMEKIEPNLQTAKRGFEKILVETAKNESKVFEKGLENALNASYKETLSAQDEIDYKVNECIPWFDLTPPDDPEKTEGVFYIRGKIYQYADTSTILLLRNKNEFRRLFVKLIIHPYFDRIFIVIIFLNTLTLALFDFRDREYEEPRNQLLIGICNFFTCLYIFEAFAKIVAHGLLFGNNTYLKIIWNIIDIFVVLIGIIELASIRLISVQSLKILKTLRPLKSINTVPSLKQLVTTLLYSLPALGNVVIFMGFFVVIFAVVGIHVFQGDYYHRCRLTEFPVNATSWPIDISQTRTCGDLTQGVYSCQKGTFCGLLEDYAIPLKYDPVRNNPTLQFGLANFDSFWQSGLAVIQTITFDSWTTNLKNLMDSSHQEIASMFQCIIVVLCSFFLLNLILAVIMQSFQVLHKKEFIKKVEYEKEELLAQIRQTQDKNKILKNKEKLKNLTLNSGLLAAPRSKAGQPNSPSSSARPLGLKVNRNKSLFSKQSQDSMSFKPLTPRLMNNKQKSSNKSARKSQPNDYDTISIFSKHSGISHLSNFGQDNFQQIDFENRYLEVFKEMTHQKRKEEERKIKEKALQIKAEIVEWQAQKKLYKFCGRLVQSTYFQLFIMVVIFLNVGLLASERYDESREEKRIKELVNIGFFVVFVFEMFLKITGLSFKIYIKDKYNLLDALVILTSTIELILKASIESEQVDAISAIRIIKIFRLFNLAKQWSSLSSLMNTIGRTFKDVSSFSMLLLMMMVTFSLLGMELFAWKVKFNEDNFPTQGKGAYPGSTFNTFNEAMFSVFIILANDGWTTILFDHYRATSWYTAVPYFLSVLVIGQYVLLNLFLAILLENFDEDSHEDTFKIPIRKAETRKLRKQMTKRFNKRKNRLINFFTSFRCCKGFKIVPAEKKQLNTPKKKVVKKALFLFPIGQGLNKKTTKIVRAKAFNLTIFLCIFSQIFVLWLDNPLDDPNGPKRVSLYYLDQVFTAIFTVELILKVITQGFFFCGKSSYMRQNWNILDFFIVAFSLVPLFIRGVDQQFKYAKVFRVFKVLRPLRMISRNEGLKVSLISLFKSMSKVSQIFVVSFMFFTLLSIMGINQFQGGFGFCLTSYLEFQSLKVSNKWECLSAGGDWKIHKSNFDNFGFANLTIFHMMTTAGWAEVMYNGISSRGPDLVGEYMFKPMKGYFFILIMIVTSFFVKNLFIGIVIATYNRVRERQSKDYLISSEQKQWLNIKLMVLRSNPKLRPTEPENRCRSLRIIFFKIANSQGLESVVNLSIIISSVVMACRWRVMPPIIEMGVEGASDFFTLVFYIEILIKIIGNGRKFFYDRWNRFDFFIITCSLLSFVLRTYTSKEYQKEIALMGTLKIGRLFKLLKTRKSLKIIFTTFFMSLRAMINLGGLLLLFLFIFALLGVQLFAEVKLNGSLDENLSFQTVGSAILILLKVITGDAWHTVLFSVAQERSLQNNCETQTNYQKYKEAGFETVGCGDPFSAVLYFAFFVVMLMLILLNIFIAIILMGYEQTKQMIQNDYNLDVQLEFIEEWSKFDPDASGTILVPKLDKIMGNMGPPLGWESRYKRTPNLRDEFYSELKFNPHGHGLYCEYYDVLEKLALHLTAKQQVKEQFKDDPTFIINNFDCLRAKKLLLKKKMYLREAEKCTPSLASREIKRLQRQKKRPVQVTLGNAFMLKMIWNHKFREAIGRKSHPPTYGQTRQNSFFNETIQRFKNVIKEQLGTLQRENSIRPIEQKQAQDQDEVKSQSDIGSVSAFSKMTKQQLIAKRIGRRMFNIPSQINSIKSSGFNGYTFNRQKVDKILSKNKFQTTYSIKKQVQQVEGKEEIKENDTIRDKEAFNLDESNRSTDQFLPCAANSLEKALKGKNQKRSLGQDFSQEESIKVSSAESEVTQRKEQIQLQIYKPSQFKKELKINESFCISTSSLEEVKELKFNSKMTLQDKNLQSEKRNSILPSVEEEKEDTDVQKNFLFINSFSKSQRKEEEEEKQQVNSPEEIKQSEEEEEKKEEVVKEDMVVKFRGVEEEKSLREAESGREDLIQSENSPSSQAYSPLNQQRNFEEEKEEAVLPLGQLVQEEGSEEEHEESKEEENEESKEEELREDDEEQEEDLNNQQGDALPQNVRSPGFQKLESIKEENENDSVRFCTE